MSTQEAKQIAARMIELGLAKPAEAKDDALSDVNRIRAGKSMRKKREELVRAGLTTQGTPRVYKLRKFGKRSDPNYNSKYYRNVELPKRRAAMERKS
jgi:hypothetical protein